MHPGVLVKVAVTPILIGSAAWAGRRFGDAVGGWVVGLPLTSAPILFFISVEHGTAFGAATALGVLGGALSQIAFAAAYGWTSMRDGAAVSLGAGSLAFALATIVLAPIQLSGVVTTILVLVGLMTAVRLMPGSGERRAPRSAPVWDVPLRMVLATLLVLALTTAAPALGPRLSGLLAPYPIFAGVMTVFAHRSSGGDAARDVLRGLLFGMFSFTAFFVVASMALVPFGVGPAFLTATAAALAAHGLALAALRRAVYR